MAKNEGAGNQAGGAEGAAEAAPKADKRRIVLKGVGQTFGDVATVDGNEVISLSGEKKDEPRADFIRRAWGTRQYTRRQITNTVSKLQGEEIPYQIVFQATKGVEGGPEPKAEAPAGDNAGAQTAEATA